MSWNQGMQHYMKEHLPLYVFVSVLFVMGVVFGAVMVNALTLEQQEEMARFFGSFFHLVNEGDRLDAQVTFQHVFAMHMKWILLIWILGLSVIGLPIILILDFLKGVLIGFTVGYLTGQLSWKGIAFALVSVAPHNLIVIPILIICSVTAVTFSIQLVKNRLLHRRGSIYHPFMRYSLLTLSLSALIIVVSLFEAYLMPHMMRWVTPMLVTLH